MKRHEALVQLSRDHHFGLLLCWKLKEGLKREVSPDRMEAYIIAFYEQNLKPHFREEEETVFKLLGEDHSLIKEAMEQHQKFHQLIGDGLDSAKKIQEFRDLLELHIRTEERQIFPEIEQVASEEQLQNLLNYDYPALKEPEWDDVFWK